MTGSENTPEKVITCEECLARLDGDFTYWCGLSHKTKTVRPTDTCDKAKSRREWEREHGF